MKEEEKTCTCGVPNEIHATCCGWSNTGIFVFPWESNVSLNMTDDEKKDRYYKIKEYFSKHESDRNKELREEVERLRAKQHKDEDFIHNHFSETEDVFEFRQGIIDYFNLI